MLTVHHISKAYNIQPILEDVSFSINPGDRLGLIGPNGSGKTTLLRILAGHESPDRGAVVATRTGLRIGYLTQGFAPRPGITLGELLEQSLGNPAEVENELARLAGALALDPQDRSLQDAYQAALERMQALDFTLQPSVVLEPLGLAGIDPGQAVESLSGGQKTRLSLALVLLQDPLLLLLDEPTNHLDIAMLEWLENWLGQFSGAALIVSHDRTFLDNTVNRILDLNPETHTIREYSGNYTGYLDQYLAERERLAEAYSDQLYEIRRMRQDIARTKQQSLRVELTTTSRQPGVRRYAKKVAKKAKSREKKLERFMESDERVEKPKESWQMKLEFGEPVHVGQGVLKLEELAVGYPGGPALLSGLDLQVRLGQRIAITGPNGAGKTTLLRTIAGKLDPLSGQVRLGASIRLGYMAQEQELLDLQRSALEIIQHNAPFNETEARSFLHYFLFSGDDPLRPARDLSFGERARLELAVLVVNGCNLLLLDEPINHLDIPSRARFEQALANFNGTILAVVHDRYFIDRFASELWLVEDGALHREVLSS